MSYYPVVSRATGAKPPSSIEIFDCHAEIELTRGFKTMVDVADVPFLAGYRWTTLINSQTGHAYAVRYERGKCYLMHRELLGAPPDKQVDHEDGDGLNNRRSNIRIASPSQNIANIAVTRRNKLGVKGVSLELTRYRAVIECQGKRYHLGRYSTKEEAAAAYRGAARVLFGEFAHE